MHKKNKITIFLIEDDPSQLKSIESLLEFKGFVFQSFKNAMDFLTLSDISRPAVLVSDMRLPDLNGVELYKALTDRGEDIPIIFISGESSIQQSIDAMKQGAIEFLVKPFDINDLTNAIEKATRLEHKRVNLKTLLKNLSPREKQVFDLLIQGLNNSELMKKINVSLPTAKQYKSEVMRKLGVKSLSELMNLSNQTV
ncbi:response regulator transcription factor [Candidatus Methylopumilus rimovensis]|jgi:two-component system response regulator FixJ|uniref:Response regulator transcription factor n=1 Tax=Candidatus Methylopumilus rimovensis TaxID=2588535 RepID=A0AAE6KPG0_9PROT|nr:response regulator [Candidatus Methylopumilus rimovensis]QDD13636.1 response regulator transcription factor [Candidatus Methylopumilus rimovensis]